MTQKPKRLFITALFGSIIFVVNVFLPPPINYVLIVVQAVLLALSGLFIKAGASYVGAVGGLLTALGSPALGPFTFLFSFLFGVLVDGFLFIFRITASPERVNRNRLMAAMAFSTMLIGLISYSAFALFPQFIPFSERVFKRWLIYSKKHHARCACIIHGSSYRHSGWLCCSVFVE